MADQPTALGSTHRNLWGSLYNVYCTRGRRYDGAGYCLHDRHQCDGDCGRLQERSAVSMGCHGRINLHDQ